jgi:hypothetical protein
MRTSEIPQSVMASNSLFACSKIFMNRAEIRQVISEFAQGLHDSADIGPRRLDEKVDIQCRPSVAVSRESRRADHDEDGSIFV